MSWKMKERYGLREEEDDFSRGGDGGGQDDDLDELLGIDEDGDEEGDDDDDPPTQQMSPEQIADLAVKAAERVGQRNAPPQKELTQDELDKQLKRYKVSPDLVAAIRNAELAPEKVAELFQQMVDGSVQHALTAANYLIQDKHNPLQAGLQAQQQFVVEQKTKEFVGKVEKNFGALKGYGKVIRQAIDHLRANNYNAPNKTAAIKEVARTAASIIRTINPQFSLKAGGNGTRQAGSFGARRSGGGGGPPQSGGVGAKSLADLF